MSNTISVTFIDYWQGRATAREGEMKPRGKPLPLPCHSSRIYAFLKSTVHQSVRPEGSDHVSAVLAQLPKGLANVFSVLFT